MSESKSQSACGLIDGDGALYECKASSDLAEAFTTRSATIVCSAEELLFSHGKPGRCVYLVLRGEVGLFLPLTTMDGMGFRAQAGAFLGLPAAFSNEPYSMTAVAHKGAEVAVMSREKFCELVASDPVFALDVLRIWQPKLVQLESQSSKLRSVDGSKSLG